MQKENAHIVRYYVPRVLIKATWRSIRTCRFPNVHAIHKLFNLCIQTLFYIRIKKKETRPSLSPTLSLYIYCIEFLIVLLEQTIDIIRILNLLSIRVLNHGNQFSSPPLNHFHMVETSVPIPISKPLRFGSLVPN